MRTFLALAGIMAAAFLLIPAAGFADGMEEKPPGVQNLKKQPSAVQESVKPAPPKAAPAGAAKPGTGNTKPLDDFELARYQYCGTDKDCVVSINGCCDCANGGIEVAVNKERRDDFRKRFDCLYFECSHKPANPPCANGVVSCVNHKCRYFDTTKR
ncbi:MAG TPA: hypothetical protein PLP17_12220 [Oligoflexia bacterium]|nr:hypothetical protein [Oligoflexia bacterium]